MIADSPAIQDRLSTVDVPLPDRRYRPADRLAMQQEATEIYSRADSLPVEARETLRDVNVIFRIEDPSTGVVAQCHFFLLDRPVRKPKPGMLARGANIKSGFRGQQCGSIDGFRVFHGSGRDGIDVRSTAARLHSAMIRECGSNGTVLTDVPDSREIRDQQGVFLVLDEDRAVAFATTSLATSATLLGCHVEDGRVTKDRCIMASLIPGVSVRQVELLWVARDYRRQGLGEALLRFVAEHHGEHPGRLAFQRPFTPGGLRTICRTAGNRFWTTGEMSVVTATPERWLTPHRVLSPQEIMIPAAA